MLVSALKHWRVKGVVQKVLSAVPGGTAINDALQRRFGELRDVDRTIDSKVVDDWLVLAAQLREVGKPVIGAELMEVGTGWFPTFPLCFALAGAGRCHTFDLTRHLSEDLTHRTIARLRHHLDAIAEVTGQPIEDVGRRYDALCSAPVAAALRHAGIDYHAPADAARTGLPARSVDVVFSNSVLEHVPPAAIAAIFVETRRVLRPDGLAFHSVNCCDHYAYFDRSITFINYLRFSEQKWRFWNNDLLYQNRLRPQDFLELATQADLEIVLSRWQPKPHLLATLQQMPVAGEFRRYSPEQLCTTSIDFVARPSR